MVSMYAQCTIDKWCVLNGALEFRANVNMVIWRTYVLAAARLVVLQYTHSTKHTGQPDAEQTCWNILNISGSTEFHTELYHLQLLQEQTHRLYLEATSKKSKETVRNCGFGFNEPLSQDVNREEINSGGDGSIFQMGGNVPGVEIKNLRYRGNTGKRVLHPLGQSLQPV
ncbi:hypothetical protein PR048_002533 [Dryococelus australis]|uniref:Uncharacterized protein n=1 Tax=Dryococelus australis TaxID=614101 RepID=A0ABQ9IL69_9NEOP|nr:hypothetical protein PR048_002533 [Dryococelus australis]